jgi:hypothetical protein
MNIVVFESIDLPPVRSNLNGGRKSVQEDNDLPQHGHAGRLHQHPHAVSQRLLGPPQGEGGEDMTMGHTDYIFGSRHRRPTGIGTQRVHLMQYLADERI